MKTYINKQVLNKNIPENAWETIYQDAIKNSFHTHVDKLDCSISWARILLPDMTIKEAYKKYIENYSPYYTIIFRNESYSNLKNKDYWEFTVSSLSSCDGAYYYIWINVDVDNAEKIIKKYNLEYVDFSKLKNI